MSKPLVRASIIIGVLFFLISVMIHSKAFFIIGLVFMAMGLLAGFGPDGILRKEQILDNWAVLIGGGQGRSQEIFSDTEMNIKNNRVPSLITENKSMAPGMVSGLLGSAREFLVVTNEQNLRLKPYQVFLNARDYGNNLDISWYLTYRPPLWPALASMIPFTSRAHDILTDLDLFDHQDLRAYVTVAHHSLLQAVDKLLLSINQDPAKIDRKSKGFLGIS